MAELILNDEEKAAELWSDLDDAALGKLVKKQIYTIAKSADQLDRAALVSAAVLICCGAAEVEALRGAVLAEREACANKIRDLRNQAVTPKFATMRECEAYSHALDDAESAIRARGGATTATGEQR